MNAMLDHFKRVWKGEEKLWKVFWLWGVVGNIPLLIYFLDRTGFINSPIVHYRFAFKLGWFGGVYATFSIVLLIKSWSNINQNKCHILKITEHIIIFIFIGILVAGSLASGGIAYTLMFLLGY